jgi:predicted nucleic acid-binding protein
MNMVFIDSNIFLRFLAYSPHVPPIDQRRGERAGALFRAIERGEIEATTTEVVLREVMFVLLSDSQYRYRVADVVPRMRYLINLRGMRFSAENLHSYNAALDLLEAQPALGFADAVIAMRSRIGGHTLATFDAHFDRVDDLGVWALEGISPEPGTEMSVFTH